MMGGTIGGAGGVGDATGPNADATEADSKKIRNHLGAFVPMCCVRLGESSPNVTCSTFFVKSVDFLGPSHRQVKQPP